MSKELEGLARRWLSTLSRRDFDQLGGMLEPDVRFRALTPPGLREASDPTGVVSRFRDWFGVADVFVMRSSNVDLVADRVSVTYRIDVHENGEWLTVEQTMIGASGTHGFSSIDLLCSGFRPIAQPSDLVLK